VNKPTRRIFLLGSSFALNDGEASAMFELFSGERRRASHRSTIPVLISTAAHLIVVGILLAISVVYVTTELPQVPDMLAFVASAAPPPPPPPPPAPASTASKRKVTKPVPTVSPRAAPVEAPPEIVEETHVDTGSEEGVQGGIEGGVAGGVVGGIVGGLVATDLPPPPPPPPAPIERGPVRVGGEVKAPALLERVEPEYPPLAVRAQVQGVVILEAVVDRQGGIEDVRVLRSIPLLDGAAIAAVRQWRYSPLLLNGKPERFVLTVTLNFSLST
jgi:periplasmic protein TonB